MSNWKTIITEVTSNYDEELNNAVVHLEGIEIEVCGMWVWVSGDTKPHKDALGKNGAGYRWAPKKKKWYYRHSECKSRGSRGKFSMNDIRERHGSEKIKEAA